MIAFALHGLFFSFFYTKKIRIKKHSSKQAMFIEQRLTFSKQTTNQWTVHRQMLLLKVIWYHFYLVKIHGKRKTIKHQHNLNRQRKIVIVMIGVETMMGTLNLIVINWHRFCQFFIELFYFICIYHLYPKWYKTTENCKDIS